MIETKLEKKNCGWPKIMKTININSTCHDWSTK